MTRRNRRVTEIVAEADRRFDLAIAAAHGVGIAEDCGCVAPFEAGCREHGTRCELPPTPAPREGRC